jgi:hypothetical protein
MRNISNEYRETQNTHFVFNNLFSKSCHVWDNVEKYMRAEQFKLATQRKYFACWVTKAADTQDM